MLTETFKIVQADQLNDPTKIVRLLKSQSGVRDVMLIAAKQECSVLFDEQTISSGQLQAFLHEAGIQVTIAKAGTSPCCGSCGG